MKARIFLGLILAGFVMFFTSCNKPPQPEMDAAAAAVNEAKAAGADVYLPDEFSNLSDSLNSVMVQIEGKKSKWFARYKEEVVKLQNVNTMAAQVKENTAIRKEEIRNEIQTKLVELGTLLEENKTLLTQAPKGKEGAAALEAIKDELAVLDGAVAEINTLLAADDLIKAQNKVQVAMDKAVSINTELKEAIEKYKMRRGK